MDLDLRGWAAGIFEGEGCFYNNNRSLAAKVSMTDEDVLRKFHKAVGMGKVYGPYPGRTGNKPYWTWQVNGSTQWAILVNMFAPYMGERRRSRAAELWAAWETRKNRKAK